MTRRCTQCGGLKPLEEFAVRGDAPHRRVSSCRPCAKEYQRQWHQRHGERRRAKNAVVRANRRAVTRAYVNSVKAVPCADCGRRYPPHIMDFDHVRGEKASNVSAMVAAGLPLWRIKDEIAKCEVVCANCHRIRTFRQPRNDDAASEERGIYVVPPQGLEPRQNTG